MSYELKKPSEIKMILTDLDETLLPSNKEITPRTIEVFAQCRQKGILTGFATARAELPAKKYLDILKPDIAVLDNGGLVKIHGKTVSAELMDADDVDEIVQKMLQIRGLGTITVETEDAFYCNCDDIIGNYGMDYAHGVYHSFSKPLHSKSFKMTVETTHGEDFYEVMKDYPQYRGFPFAMNNWFCICPRSVTKGAGAMKAAAYLNIPASQVAAFGDDISDIELLQQCGHGVAMINALPNVKEAGQYLTEYDYNHDGVARYIVKNFLNV